MKKYFTLFIALSFITIRSFAQWGTITTIAGNGYDTCAGDGGQATNAELSDPQYITVANSGNVYVSGGILHGDKQVIRKIDVSTGIISTVCHDAGNGFGGDGGLATDASFGNGFTAICTDSAENLYVLDKTRVRRIDAQTNIITTIAGIGTFGVSGDGGLATDAKLVDFWMCADTHSNIYIGYGRIRKIDASTGIITTYAGTNTTTISGDGGLAVNAGLGDWRAICMDASNNMYCLTVSPFQIRKIDATTGIINTIFQSQDSLTGVYSMSVASDNSLYISVMNENIVVKITDGSSYDTVAGSGTWGFSGDGGPSKNAELNNPYSIHFNSSGDLFIADEYNLKVRKISSTLSVNNIPSASSLTISPNPSTGIFTVKSGAAYLDATCIITNILGQTIYSSTLTNTQQKIDLTIQPPGIYFLKVNKGNTSTTQKLIRN